MGKTLAIIISMYKESKLYMQMSDHLKLAKSIMTSIIYYHNKQPEHLLQLTKQASRPLKLDD